MNIISYLILVLNLLPPGIAGIWTLLYHRAEGALNLKQRQYTLHTAASQTKLTPVQTKKEHNENSITPQTFALLRKLCVDVLQNYILINRFKLQNLKKNCTRINT